MITFSLVHTKRILHIKVVMLKKCYTIGHIRIHPSSYISHITIIQESQIMITPHISYSKKKNITTKICLYHNCWHHVFLPGLMNSLIYRFQEQYQNHFLHSNTSIWTDAQGTFSWSSTLDLANHTTRSSRLLPQHCCRVTAELHALLPNFERWQHILYDKCE